ncbi:MULTISPECIES: hypothetical protein [Myxococcus]|uniref:hypothetical protein n=1 Tax=Myxococcus TaxID=32 RepID=UPI001F083EF3|nr:MULTISPECIES: hypothetical protein [Myxococcus]
MPSEWSNADPHLSPDGRTVYFISNRPLPDESGARASYDIWAASLGADGEWGDARRLPSPVNDANLDEWSPAVAANGNLYFGGERSGTLGGSDLWVSRWVDGAYQPPENLGAAINTTAHELEPWIAPDESCLLFSALRRPEGLGGYDLFLSRRVNGTWEPARRLCEGVNSRASDYNHSVSPDGKWLYFSSTRPFTGDVGERFDTPRDQTLALEGWTVNVDTRLTSGNRAATDKAITLLTAQLKDIVRLVPDPRQVGARLRTALEGDSRGPLSVGPALLTARGARARPG